MKQIKDWKILIISILISQLAGVIGTLFSTPAIPIWYATLEKPFFSPPNVVFGPVWITLYTLMGISLFLVWTSKSKKKERALSYFFVQLGLNTLWSYLFFGLQSPLLGLVGILGLLVAIIVTIREFRKISKNAAYLLYPYLAWVTFATLLNFFIWLLN